MKKKNNKLINNFISPLLAVITILLIWWIAALATSSQLILPTPIESLKTLIYFLGKSEFWLATLKTLLSSLIAFAAAMIFAVGFAALAQINKAVKAFMRTIVRILRAVPTMSVIILMIIWTTSNITPILVSLLVVFPTLYAGIAGSMESIDVSLEETAKIYKIPLSQRIVKIYAPMCAPSFLETAAGAISLNLKLIIAAEVMAHTRNTLGEIMWQSQMYFETGRVLAITIVAVAIAALLEGGILLVKKLTIDW